MKKLLAITAMLVSTACTPSAQHKVKTAVDVVECKVDTLKPYLGRLTSDEFLAAVAEKEYFAMLVNLGLDPTEVKETVAALKACHNQ